MRLQRILEPGRFNTSEPVTEEEARKRRIASVPIITDADRNHYRNVGGAEERFKKKMEESKAELEKFRELRQMASKNLASYQPGAII